MIGVNVRARKKKLLLIVIVVGAAAAVFASPAAAISQITNTFTRSDSTVTTGQKVNFKAKTVYDWQYAPNPYTSDFYTEVSYGGFNKPVTTASQGLSEAWAYKNPGWFLTSAWYIDSGVFTVVTARTKSMDFYATAKSGWSSCRTRHGQSEHWDVSWGNAAWRTFTHN